MIGHYYELRCVDCQGFFTYYYFYSPRIIRRLETALYSGYAPDGLRLLVAERGETPFIIKPLPIFNYLYKKYFKRAGTFHCGERINWEKELKNRG